MTDCASCRERLMEASPAELRRVVAGRPEGRVTSVGPSGPGSKGIAGHLARCPACRAEVERVVDGLDALDMALDGPPDGIDVDLVLRRARNEQDRAGRRWPRHPVRIAAALLAAATLALLFRQQSDGPPPRPTPVIAALPSVPDVEVPAGRNVAVLPTDNPAITVLWFF